MKEYARRQLADAFRAAGGRAEAAGEPIPEGSSIEAEIAKAEAAKAQLNEERAAIKAQMDESHIYNTRDNQARLKQIDEIVRETYDRRISLLRSGDMAQLERTRQAGIAYQQDPYTGGKGYSSASAAVGGGRLGAGDLRGTVVSTSRTEDIAREREAGYSGKVTLDPRSQFFKTTEGMPDKATPTREIIREYQAGAPQKPRPKIEQGVKEKLYASPEFQTEPIPRKDNALLEPERRVRPKALQGQPPSQYQNPDYVIREKESTQRASLFGFAPSAKPTGKFTNVLGVEESKTLAVSLSEGKPKQPRQLTQADAQYMSADEIAKYNADVNAWNAYVDKETQRVAMFNAEQKKKFIEQKRANLQEYEQSKKEILASLAEIRKTGASTIIINTKTGSREVPIEKAYIEILSKFDPVTGKRTFNEDIIGIGVIPQVPEGYTPVTLSAEPVLVSVPTQEGRGRTIAQDITGKITEYEKGNLQYGPQKPAPKDVITMIGERATQIAENPMASPVQRGLAGLAQEGVSLVGGVLNLERMSEKAFAEAINATFDNTTKNENVTKLIGLRPEITTPETIPDVGIRELAIGAKAAAVSRNPILFGRAVETAIRKGGDLVAKQGVAASVGQGVGFIIPLGGRAPISIAKGVLEVIPETAAKGSKFVVRYMVKEKPFIQEFKTLQAATKFKELALKQKEVSDVIVTAYKTPMKSLMIGSGETAKPIISKVDKKFTAGSPLKIITKDVFEGVSPTGRGLEFGTEGSYLQKIFTSEKGKDVLQEAGLLTEQGRQYIPVAQEIAKSVKKVQKKIKLSTKQDIFDVNFEAVLPGKEKTALIERVIPKLKKIKGGASQILQVEKNLLEGTGRGTIKDIDVDYDKELKWLENIGLGRISKSIGVKKALKAAELGERELNLAALGKAAPDITDIGKRVFVREGTKVVVGNLLKPSETIKIPIISGKYSFDTGKTISGISKSTGKKVLSEGINLEETPRGLYFSTPNKKLAAQYVGKKEEGIILEHEWKMDRILRWRDVPKRERNFLKALDIKNRVQRFYVSQERIMDYAKSLNKNYLGATRPYEPGSRFYEIFAWNEQALKSTRQIKPVRTIIKTTPAMLEKRTKVLELLTDEDVVPRASVSPIENLEKVFGTKYDYRTTIGKTPGGKKYKLRTIADQLLTKVTSTASLQGPRSEGALRTDVDFLKPGAKIPKTERGFFFYTPSFRVKDIVDQPFLLRQLAKDVRASGLGSSKAAKFEALASKVENIFPEVEFKKGSVEGVTERALPEKPSLLSRVPSQAKSAPLPILLKTNPSATEEYQSRINSMISGSKSRGLPSKISMQRSSLPESQQTSLLMESAISKKSLLIKSSISARPSGISAKSPSVSGISARPSGISAKSPSVSGISPLSVKSLKVSPLSTKSVPLEFLKPSTTERKTRFELGIKKKDEFTKEKLKRSEFIGNVRQEDILGMYKGFTTKVGIKKSRRQARKDILLTRKEKGFTKFVTQKKSKFLSARQTPILGRPKKKELLKLRKRIMF